jgi:hypothetical protein
MTTDYVSFDDVLDELAIEGAAPDYATLLQWQKRYPKYRETLAAHFALWAIQSEPIDPLPEIDEEAIVRQGVEYAMGLLRKQGRLIEDDKVEKLGAFDQLVLTAITLLQGEGNSVSITKRLSEFLGREALLGSTLMSCVLPLCLLCTCPFSLLVDRHNPASFHVRHPVHLPARPSDLDGIGLYAASQSEGEDPFVLREVA